MDGVNKQESWCCTAFVRKIEMLPIKIWWGKRIWIFEIFVAQNEDSDPMAQTFIYDFFSLFYVGTNVPLDGNHFTFTVYLDIIII